MSDLLSTPLLVLHQQLGAKLVPFAGFNMPVQYPLGVLKEHLHVRQQAGLFDVSHMVQITIKGEHCEDFLETILPSDIAALKPMQQRYTVLPNAQGGLLDDLMIARREDDFYLVLNAACKAKDLAYLQQQLPPQLELCVLEDKALLALQGPKAAEVLATINPAVQQLKFMQTAFINLNGTECYISRSGYTGEDGFEISLDADKAETLCRALLEFDAVEMIGLGARDSLRLEAGLCLYGNDLDENISPIEADLAWVVSKTRRLGGIRAGGFPGSERILNELSQGVSKKRCGFKVQGRAPVRAGADIITADEVLAGQVCSGGPAPSLGEPVVMAYIDVEYLSQPLFARLRKKLLPLQKVDLPFVPHGYAR